MNIKINKIRNLRVFLTTNGFISFFGLICVNTLFAKQLRLQSAISDKCMLALIIFLAFASLSLIYFLIFVFIPLIVDFSKGSNNKTFAIDYCLKISEFFKKYAGLQTHFKNAIDVVLVTNSIFWLLSVFHSWWWESQRHYRHFIIISLISCAITCAICLPSICKCKFTNKDEAKILNCSNLKTINDRYEEIYKSNEDYRMK